MKHHRLILDLLIMPQFNSKKGYPNHVYSQGTVHNECVRMKWTTETMYQGDANLGMWVNDECSHRFPFVCSHEQEP